MPTDLPDIPVARRVAHRVTHHGVTIEDPYAWLRDPAYPQVNDPDVLGYLKAENEYFRLGGHAVSPDGRLLAYAVDTNGSERFVLKVRDLETGVELPDLIENWRYGLVWAADSRSFLYTDADEHWRSKTVWHHRLGN